MPTTLTIGSRREFFWDNALIDQDNTSAEHRVHQPQPREVVLVHDQPWEGDGCDFHCILEDVDCWRMYYLSWEMLDPAGTVHPPRPPVVAYAESRDGRHWIKPDLGLCEFAGSKNNNIILDSTTGRFDNFSVFKDKNPACPENEVYKGVGIDCNDRYLWCFTSSDGIRFKKAWRLTNQGKFDTLNIALWDRHSSQYFCYVRDFHQPSGNDFGVAQDDLSAGIRDIRWMTSPDFRTWSVPERLDFGAAPDYPLYTNVVQPYYRADHIFVGFPSRYIERKEWTSNYEQLPGAQRRRERMKLNPRYGLALTDCVFMSSRDGKNWTRWDEAFMRPGPEREYNWVYGDCYPAVGLLEIPSALPHAPNELSLYAFDNHWAGIPTELRRYTLRVDGFVSYHAGYTARRISTKPFVFAGNELSINFATSAAGYVKIIISCGDAHLQSVELFGDNTDRRVTFEEGTIADFAGKPVQMKIIMSDADLYSFRFLDHCSFTRRSNRHPRTAYGR